ncbi:MAG: hypothetical protein V7L27_24390 [Nostoc sp.]
MTGKLGGAIAHDCSATLQRCACQKLILPALRIVVQRIEKPKKLARYEFA